MLRRLFLTLIVLASLAFIGLTLWQSTQEKVQTTSSLSLLADDAVLILEVNDAKAFHSKLKNGSVLWPDLIALEWASSAEVMTSDIDSLLTRVYRQFPDSSISYTMSLHPSGKDKHSWLFCIPAALFSSSDLTDILSTTGYTLEKERDYDQASIYRLENGGNTYFALQSSLALYVGTSMLSLERHARMSNDNILNDQRFKKSYDTRGSQSLAHLHVDWNSYPNVLSRAIPRSDNEHMISGLGGWATSDLLFDANTIYSHGLIQTSDSMRHHLQKHRKQGVGSFEDILDLIPSTTACFNYQHISHLNNWAAAPDSIIGLMGHGFLQAFSEERQITTFIPINDETETSSWLKAMGGIESEIFGRRTWKGIPSQIFRSSYGESLFHSEVLLACIMNETLILSSDEATMKHLLLQHRNGRTIGNDEPFQQLQDDISDRSALFHYFNVARCKGLIKDLCSKELADQLSRHEEQLQKFQALIIQYEPAADGLFHQNIMLRHNPVYKKESSSIWEIQMDSLNQESLSLIKNHYTEQYDILVQDIYNGLHLFDNTGRLLWTVELGEEVKSSITQVDLFKNGKLQMAFNTDTRLVILDRKGRMVEGFPIQLSDTASSEVAVMDYDRNKNYRFLLATRDGQLHNYDRDGNAVKGWKYKADDEAIVGRMKHFTLRKKDYITTIGENGSLRFLERNGKLRFGGKDLSITSYDEGPYHILPGKKIRESSILYQNSQGELMQHNFEGANSLIHEEGQLIVGQKGKYVVDQDNLLKVFDLKGEEKRLIDHKIESSKLDYVGAKSIGIFEAETGLYFLYNQSGQLRDGFPIPGQHALLKDINLDGSTDLIISSAEGFITVYSLN